MSSSEQMNEIEQHRCAICLEDLPVLLNIDAVENEYYHSRCGHITHSHCLQSCVKSGNYNCPLCRQPLGDISVELAVVDKPLVRYVKMLKSGLSPPVIRQRMTVDGIDSTIIDAFFTGGASRALVNKEEEERESVKQESVRKEKLHNLFEKYRKMLDMGMPEGAVRQKMQQVGGEDRLTLEEIEQFFTNQR